MEDSGKGGEAGLEESGQGGETGPEARHRSPEKMCAPIRGADIVARTTVPLAAGEGCTYEWKGHGLRLQVPADALEPLSPPATIIIQASLSGHYHLPDNTQLVSAVYWIAFPGKFSRPVTLEVHHCAALEQSHTLSSLSFVRAKCSQETLPYNFKRIQGGVFSASSRHGAIELSHFSGVGIASEESEQSKHYTAHTFYIHQSPTTWLMHFIIICDLELLFRAVEKHYFEKGAETGPYLEVAFDRDEVAMEIEEDGVTLDNGWSLVPLVCPTSILRESVDNFKPGKPIPSCQLELYWTKREQPADRLKHRLKLTGVRRHTSITITRDPTLPDRRTRGSDYKKGEGKSNRDSDTVPQPAATNVLDIDDLIDVKCELIPIASKWKDIGLALRLKPTTLDTIEKNRKDAKDCLSDVLTQWLNKAYNMQRFGEPSWQLLVSAVRHPAGGDNQALADTMATKYGVS